MLKLSTTDLAPADLAQSLIAGCPQWRRVAAELVAMMAIFDVERKEE